MFQTTHVPRAASISFFWTSLVQSYNTVINWTLHPFISQNTLRANQALNLNQNTFRLFYGKWVEHQSTVSTNQDLNLIHRAPEQYCMNCEDIFFSKSLSSLLLLTYFHHSLTNLLSITLPLLSLCYLTTSCQFYRIWIIRHSANSHIIIGQRTLQSRIYS